MTLLFKSLLIQLPGGAAEITAKRTKSRETYQREYCDYDDTQIRRCDEKGCNRDHGEKCKTCGGYSRRLHRTREGCLVDPKFIETYRVILFSLPIWLNLMPTLRGSAFFLD
jgi:hypothetical protein